eukprot:scaffold41796_cov51-Attheya_sp.AAC.1
MKATDKSYTQAKKDFVAAGGKSKDFEKKKYEIVCGGYILAHPLKKWTKKKDKDKQDMALLSHDHGVIIKVTFPHTCVGPPIAIKG